MIGIDTSQQLTVNGQWRSIAAVKLPTDNLMSIYIKLAD